MHKSIDSLCAIIDYLSKKLFGSSIKRRTDDIPGQQHLFDETEVEQDLSLWEEEALIGEEYVRRSELEFIPAACKMSEYYSQSYGCPSWKAGLGYTEKPVIVKSQVPQALIGKGPATASTVAWTMYQKYANGRQWASPLPSG